MRTILASVFAASILSGASQQPFAFDKQLAADLASAYVRSHFRARPDHVIRGIDLSRPQIDAIVVIPNRHLVVVTFRSSQKPSGAFVVLEQCAASDLLVAAESGTVGELRAYRAAIRAVIPNTFVTAPIVCPVE